MRVLLLVPSVLCVVLANSSMSQNSVESRATLLGLNGVAILVDSLAAQIEDKGITHKVLRVEVERCLLRAGIPVLNRNGAEPTVGDPILYLAVTTVFDEGVQQCTYGISLELTQPVRLDRQLEGDAFLATTWSVSGVGIYGHGWRDAIIQDVVNFTDEFIDAYITANANIAE